MKCKLPILIAILATSMTIYAGPNMVMKQNDVKITYEDDITSVVFKITSDTTVEVIQDKSYSALTTLVIPEKIKIDDKIYDVTSIGDNAFRECTGLTDIKISNSVTSIGNHAFYGCSGLTSIKIPNSVTSIGRHAFYGCVGLTSIEVPNSVTTIGVGAFGLCKLLESKLLIYDNGTKCYGWIGKEKSTVIEIPESVTSIDNWAFNRCVGLRSVKIPNRVTSIGVGTFRQCINLTSIEIPNSVISIGHKAFEECINLTSVEIPNSVTTIGDGAFYGCTNLEIMIDNSKDKVTVGSDAFKECKSVKYLK